MSDRYDEAMSWTAPQIEQAFRRYMANVPWLVGKEQPWLDREVRRLIGALPAPPDAVAAAELAWDTPPATPHLDAVAGAKEAVVADDRDHLIGIIRNLVRKFAVDPHSTDPWDRYACAALAEIEARDKEMG